MLKISSLFSGIGAFEKALTNLKINYELAYFCESDKYAIKSYCAIHNVPEEKNLGDITKVDEKKLPKDIDFMLYGFPCQDISLAGKKKGLFNEDGTQTRSGLFFDALRIIKETQPKVVIAENVKNLIGKKFKPQFEIVLQSLEEAGYNNYFKVLNSRNFGIPQNRDRVFIVSIRKDIDKGNFQFPKEIPLELRLKDMLEEKVDEKYYLSDIVNEKCNLNNLSLEETNCIIREDPLEREGWHRNATEVLNVNGICRTISTQSNNLATKIAESIEGTQYISQKGVKYILSPKRGMCTDVNAVICQPLTAKGQSNWTGSFISPDIDHIERSKTIGGTEPTKIFLKNGDVIKYTGGEIGTFLRIRKLTPTETWRLMGFNDEDINKCIEAGISNTQLYKQSGNSIVVNLMEFLICSVFNTGVFNE